MYKHLAQDLVQIFNESAYLSVLLDNSIKTLNLDNHDKKLYTLILYGVCEKRLLIDFKMQPLIKGKRVKPYLKNILRIGCYVIDFMNMKDYFIVNELVKTVKKDDYKGAMFVNAILRSYQQSLMPSTKNLSVEEVLSLELSIPLDIIKLLYKQYGTNLKTFFQKYLPTNTYRINTLKCCLNDVIEVLDKEGISYSIIDGALVSQESLIEHPLFKEGMIIAQDLSSIRVGEVVAPHPSSKVLDVCSAPGGKSLHMAALMNNEGHILSCDIYDHKLKKIRENASKLGVTIIETRNASGDSYDYQELFDYVLVDAPCSGLGVINHKPDLKYHISISDIEEINKLQKVIINHASKYVKDGGVLVYSTCTINKYENEWLIKDFLNEHKEFKKEIEEIILPSSTQDGFYICRMIKGENNE